MSVPPPPGPPQPYGPTATHYGQPDYSKPISVVQPRSYAQPGNGMAAGYQQPVMHITHSPLDRDPARTTCPSCHSEIITGVHHETGAFTWTLCGISLLCGCWFGCCLIPFCVKSWKDAVHTCPNCNYILARNEPTRKF